MANTATGKGEPAKQVAIDVLRKAGEPLHAKEIAKRGDAAKPAYPWFLRAGTPGWSAEACRVVARS